jgi:hypothetical protein
MALKADTVIDVAPDLDAGVDRLASETSQEPFDRLAFARRALELVRPVKTRVALCDGARGMRVRVEAGPVWGRRPERWAVLAIPEHASRRAIALAVAELAGVPQAYAFDVLVAEEPAPS